MLSQLKRVNLLASASSKQIQGSRLRLQHVRNQVNATQSPKKVVIQSTSPPPPPPGAGAQSWGKSVVILGLGGAAIYWRNEIFEKLGVFQDEELSADVPSTGEIVTEVKKAAAVAKSSVEPTVEEIKEALKKIEKIVPVEFENGKVDWEQVKGTIVDILDSESSSAYEDGSFGPLWVRLAWHNAGTFTKSTGVGGSEGAAMRFKSEGSWGANAGLDLARATLEPVKTKYPQVSYSDIWSYAGTIAIEEMGGPEVTKMWRGGRKDKTQEQDNEKALPDGLLPDADGREHKEKPQQHVRDIFYRMGFDDKGMVALCGAHALGRCHESRSGYWGPWTSAPTTFSNEYFRLLVEEKWSKKKTHQGKPWTGPEQYESADGKLMMLPSDMALVWDPEFKKHVETYAKDEDLFFKDFAKAWIKLQEVGVKEFNGWRKYIFFGERV